MRTHLLKTLSACCLGLALFGLPDRAAAQLSVGAGGLAPQTFSAVPPVAQWSTLNVGPSSASFIATAAELDAAVQTNTAAAVSIALPANSTVPPALGTTAQWNSTGQYLQSRANGNTFTLLKATLRNNTGSNVSTIVISYDLGALVAAGSSIVEEVPGFRAYYSLTGAAGTWVHIPELDSASPSSSGPKAATLNLGAWAPNANLFLLWADDNGSAGSTAPNHEGGYTIDNFAVAFPFPSIVTQPVSQSTSPGLSVTFSVTASGTAPLSYQWRKNSNNIPNATGTNYTIASVTQSDQGFYSVVVSNPLGSVTSTDAFLSISCSAPAAFVTQPADTNLNRNGVISLGVTTSGTAPIRYQWYRNGVPLANATNSTYVKAAAQPGDSGAYTVVINNCFDSPISSSAAVVSVIDFPYVLMGLTSQVWKYEESNTSLGSAWRATNYNDAAWRTGRGVFAFENQATINALTNTVLTLGTPSIITHYFRTSFVLTNDPATVTLTSSNYVDDGMVVYLNGVEAFRYNMPNGDVQFGTLAPAANPGGEGVPIVSNLPPSLLVLGTNVLAVEVHQNSATSSDVVFGMEINAASVPATLLRITNQPVNVSVEETKPATLTLGLQGQPAYFQWYRDGVAVPNGTFNPLIIPIASTNDAGNYYVVATNTVNSVTSSVVTLSVRADTNSPTLVDADGTASATTILVSFSERVLASSATVVGNYRVNNTAGGSLTVSSAVVTNGTNVLLTTAPRLANNNYMLVVNSVRDLSPRQNIIATNSTIPIRSMVSILAMNGGGWDYYDPFPPFDEPNLGTAWKEVTYDTSAWAHNGSSVFFNGFDEDAVPGPIGSALSQTETVTSYFRRPFNLQASLAGLRLQMTHIVDDGAVFYLNGTEVNRFNMPAGTVNYLTTAASTVGNPSRIGPVDLPTGSLISGNNVLAVELHQAQPIDVDKIFGLQLDAIVQSFIVGPVVIASCPKDVTVIEGMPATFEALSAGGITFQWFSNTTARINGATNSAYTIPIVTTNMEGALFRVAISNATSGSVSCDGTLHVLVDTNPPAIVSAFIGSNSTSIVLTFTERMAAATAQTLANYSVTNAAGSTPALTGATLVNGTNVVLSFAGTLAGRYTVVVNNLRDTSSRANVIAPNSAVTVGAEYSFGMTSPWKYLLINTNAEIQSSFASIAFNDSSWAGPSNGLFYVEGAALPFAKSTPLSLFDSGGVNRINTFYFRKSFVAPVGATNATMIIRHVVDDGLVLHLNGVEIYRFNMPTGPVTAPTQASGALGDAAVEGPIELVVNLLGGTNVLAAEVHQSGATSSDVVFGLEMTTSIPSGPIQKGQPVEIVTQPRSRTNAVGTAASLYVTATGATPLSYQWRRNGVNLLNQTNSTIILNPVQAIDAGNYTVVVNNSFSSATSQVATVTIGGGGDCTFIPQPRLVLERLTTNSIRLSWTATNNCGNNVVFTLQQSTSLTNGLVNPPQAAGWTNVTTVSPYTTFTTNGAQFFRLLKP